jgi:hypothetical protein
MKRPLAAVTIMLAVLTGGVVLAQSNIGWLNVVTSPPVPAQIFIDDAGTNLVTPQTQMPLVAGHHTIMVVAPGGATSKLGFSIAAGQTTSLTLNPH